MVKGQKDRHNCSPDAGHVVARPATILMTSMFKIHILLITRFFLFKFKIT